MKRSLALHYLIASGHPKQKKKHFSFFLNIKENERKKIIKVNNEIKYLVEMVKKSRRTTKIQGNTLNRQTIFLFFFSDHKSYFFLLVDFFLFC